MNPLNLRMTGTSKKVEWIIIPLLLLIQCNLPAQTAVPATAHFTALAGAVTAGSGSPWDATWNPAALAGTHHGTLQASFSPIASGIDGIVEGNMIAVFPYDSALHIAATLYGLNGYGYSELSGGCTASLALSESFSVGSTLRMRSTAIDRYGSVLSPLLDVGVTAEPISGLRIGGIVRNVTRSNLGNIPLPQEIALGTALRLGPAALLSLDVLQTLGQSASISLGIEAVPLSGLRLKGGARDNPMTLAFGFGWDIAPFVLEYGGAFVLPLGMRHSVATGFQW